MTEQSTALTFPKPKEAGGLPTVAEVQSHLNGEFAGMYAELEAQIEAQEVDLSTGTARAKIAALSASISRRKVAVADAAKLAISGQQEVIKAVTSCRTAMEKRMDELRDKARKPLTDWEAANKAREEAAGTWRARLSSIRAQSHKGVLVLEMSSEQLGQYLSDLDGVTFTEDMVGDAVDQLVEYMQAAKADLEGMILMAEKHEAEAKELEALRAEKAKREDEDAARAEAERLRIAKEAEEKAEAERVKQAAIDAEAAKKKAADDAKAEADKAIHWFEMICVAPGNISSDLVELVGKVNALVSHPGKFGAQVKAVMAGKADAIVAINSEIERQNEAREAKAREEAAAKAKADAAAEAARKEKAEADAQAKREADTAHRSKVNGGILKALRDRHAEKGWPFDEEAAKNIIRAAASGNAGAMKVEY